MQIDNSTTDFAGILFVRNPTNSASQNSQVTCAIAGTSANKAVYTLDVSGSHGWSMYTSGNNTNFNINSTYNCNSLYDRMVITSGGNVGIGTNNPLGKLHINGEILSMPLAAGASWDHIRLSHDGELARIDAGGSTSMVFSIENTATAYPNATYVERMRITSTGNVGIGTNNPLCRLDVNGSAKFSFQNDFWFNSPDNAYRFFAATNSNTYFGIGGTADNTQSAYNYRNGNVTDIFILYTNGNYSARGSYQAWSDSRIKKDIEDINDDTALQSILSIEPKTYKYIDGSKSTERVYGFIAQQIREVIPEAVVLIDNIIPNIYKNCICEDNKRIYIVLPQEVLGSLIRIGNGGSYKIILVESDYIEVEKHIGSKDIPDGEQFVYGYEVKDFHTINKEYIFTLNVCATQELHRRIEAQSVLLKSQDDRIRDLETKVATLMSNSNAT